MAMRVARLWALLSFVLALACASNRRTSSPSPSHDAERQTETAELGVRSANPSSSLESEAVALQTSIRNVHLVTTVWSPFSDVEGHPRIATNLVQQALSQVGVTSESHLVAPDEVVAAIERGEFDGSEALWKSPEREGFILFSQPYLENRLVLLARRGTDVSAKSLDDLTNKRLALVRSYAYGPEVSAAETVKKFEFATDEECLRALLSDNVDYMLVDDLLVYYLFEHTSGRAKELLVAGQHPLVLRGLHLGIRKDLNDAPTLIDLFDREIKKMMRSGEYHRSLNVSWMSFDADGDGQMEWVASGERAGENSPENRYQLFGARMKGAPRFMINEEVYENWDNVPNRYKVPPEPVDSFQSGFTAVLFDF